MKDVKCGGVAIAPKIAGSGVGLVVHRFGYIGVATPSQAIPYMGSFGYISKRSLRDRGPLPCPKVM